MQEWTIFLPTFSLSAIVVRNCLAAALERGMLCMMHGRAATILLSLPLLSVSRLLPDTIPSLVLSSRTPFSGSALNLLIVVARCESYTLPRTHL